MSQISWKRNYMMMEGLECDICHEMMNEEQLRPRIIKCGHTACTICIKKLIRNNALECPSCRQSYQVTCIDDLPVNFGVIKMIRAISKAPVGASAMPIDNNLCSIHGSLLIKRCQMCQVWICQHCTELHKQESGCSIASVEDALENMKNKHIKSAQSKIGSFKRSLEHVSEQITGIRSKNIKLHEEMDKIQEELSKVEEDENKYNQLLKDGNSALDAVVASHNSLNNANNPHDFNYHVHASLQRECYLDLWTKKTISNVIKSVKEVYSTLKSGKEVYSILAINGAEYGGKFYLKNDLVQLCTHKADPIPADAIRIPYENIRKVVESSTVTFLEISIAGTPMVELHIRLYKNFPNMTKSFTILCSGELGTNLIDLGWTAWGTYTLSSEEIVGSRNLPQLPSDSDTNKIPVTGSFMCNPRNGNVSRIGLVHQGFKSISWCVMGEIIELQTLKSLLRSAPIDEVKISNCGFILQEID